MDDFKKALSDIADAAGGKAKEGEPKPDTGQDNPLARDLAKILTGGKPPSPPEDSGRDKT